jgi:enoyl-CoA hydratase
LPVETGQMLVRREQRGNAQIVWLTIDNEAKLNTLGSPLMERLIAAVDAAGADPAVRAIVLTGAGSRAFIGGADIGEMAAVAASNARTFITRVHRCCDAVRRAPVPVIARIGGYTFGAGLEIAAACDLRVAAETATFAMPEVKLGIPSVVEAALLPMLIGWGRTRQMLLLGETVPASDALAWGLVERVVPQAGLDDAVGEWLDALLTSKPHAVRLQKALIRAWEDLPLRAAVQAGITAFAASWDTGEPAAAMAEFLAVRKSRK